VKLDWTINISAVISAMALFAAVVNYGSKVVNYLQALTYRVNVMWGQFERDHPDIAGAIEPRRWRH
jgi:hypothetical protein